ncbi:MAG: hypothetical protein IKU20_08345, partial [Lachnospiraceae bacterium]|nr:hypothetical protein [Lachnospiraceae bacterium]
MKMKKSVVSVLLALMLTACGKESSSIDAEIDKSKAEAVAQNLQQAMVEKTSVAVSETSAATVETTEVVKETLLIEEYSLDIDDLPGTWLMVGGEIEGDIWEAIPGNFEVLVFTTGMDPKGEKETIYAGTEARDYQGFLSVSYDQEMIERLDEPVYEGCGNEEWSIRIGEESEKDEDGYPKYEETYATLLDENTLLRQRYFTIDGAPCVSYQTFKRVFPGQDVEYLNVEDLYKEWELESYVDENGNELPLPSALADLSVDLDGEISWTDTDRSIDFVYSSDWRSGKGGSFLTLSEEHQAWFAGAVARIETDSEEIAQMRLYHKGGWLCLKEKEHSEIPVLDVLKTTLSREEHNDYQLICSAIRDSVRLGDDDAKQYPELTKALEALTQQKIEHMEASAKQMKDLFGEGDPDYESYFADEELLFVQRADSRVFSVREEFYSYSGGIHPMFGAVGYNYDTQTGKKLELTDVVTDFEQMMDLVQKKLFESYDKEMFYPDVDAYF